MRRLTSFRLQRALAEAVQGAADEYGQLLAGSRVYCFKAHRAANLVSLTCDARPERRWKLANASAKQC